MTDITKLKGTKPSGTDTIRQHKAMALGAYVLENDSKKYPNNMTKTTKTGGVCIPK